MRLPSRSTLNTTFGITLWALWLVPAASAQTSTDVFISSITRAGDVPSFSTPVNVTNREGYDNQPSFTPDGRAVFYTSIRDGQADVWLYIIERGSNAAVIQSPESEYSPTVMPGGTQWISVVRVEMDSVQRLWKFGPGGSTPQVIFENIKPVGYHAWIDANTAALFVLGQPPTLQIADVTTGAAQTVASNIGRSIHKVPNQRAVSFLHRVSREEAWISVYDLDTRQVRRLVQPVGDNEFYAWTPGGGLIMGQDAKLYVWSEGVTFGWREVADFSGTLTGISRVSVSAAGDRIAIVGNRM